VPPSRFDRRLRSCARVVAAVVVLATATAVPTATTARTDAPVVVNGRAYDAYVEAASKQGQFYWYTCEFDAAWVVLKTFGYEVPFEEQLAIVGHDRSIVPYAVQTGDLFTIYGGDIETAFSGDYTSSFLARTTGKAMTKLFEHYALAVEPVDTREEIEATLRDGGLVWTKATVDFLPWQTATWVTPDGDTFKTVLGNDHAVVVVGYNADAVVIRDPLGPTDTNWNRAYEYEVDWATFLAVFEAQSSDGLAVSSPNPDDPAIAPVSAPPVVGGSD
jgi:uncharacterized protein YvpB